jgi:hypothetical protein
MAVAIRAVDERLAVGTVLVGGIEVPGQTLACDAIALDIAQVRTGSLQPLARQLDAAVFDDDPAATEGGVTIPR